MILVTGANGLVGSTLVNRLRGAGKRVVTVGTTGKCDFKLDLAKVHAPLTETLPRPEGVVHLAAAVPSRTRPDSALTSDATRLIDQNVFQACEEWGCHVVYASGCSLYRNKAEQRLDELAELNPVLSSPYLQAKATGDAMYRSYERSAVLRISCPIGPGISSASVVGVFSSQLKDTGTITVYGQGTREQDFVDTRDVAKAIESALSLNAVGVYNVASGVPVTMLRLAETMVEIAGGGQVVTQREADPLEGTTARYSIAKAATALDWFPRFDLFDSLKRLAGSA